VHADAATTAWGLYPDTIEDVFDNVIFFPGVFESFAARVGSHPNEDVAGVTLPQVSQRSDGLRVCRQRRIRSFESGFDAGSPRLLPRSRNQALQVGHAGTSSWQ